ncbi:cytochrome P450 6j1-like isoform X1 [Pieris brassicae]|uniref:cytochrome P450 6j1-like isoform X1 n=1 Tax=Pieris brassicae TaxID=7116 RepID=UPI001E661034|nr:cytochrome P450 6j1-like isoform X1 [Pieris brassicae]
MLFILFLLIVIIYWKLKKHYDYWKNRDVFTDKPILFLGNLTFFLRKASWDYFYGLKRYQSVCVGIFLGWQPAIVVQSPELARKVLVEDADCFQHRSAHTGSHQDPIGANSVMLAKGPLKKHLQKIISPLLTTARLKGFCDVMNENAIELNKRIHRECVDQKKRFLLKKMFVLFASDTIVNTFLGLKVSALRGESTPLQFVIDEMTYWSGPRALELLIIQFLPAWADFLRLKFFSAIGTSYLKNLYKKLFQNRKDRGMIDRDVISHFMKLQKNEESTKDPIRFEELMTSQLGTLIQAAMLNGPVTLCHCLHELAYHTAVQERLRKEVKRGFREKEILDYDSINDMKLLNAILTETLRKYPTVSFLDRITTRKYTLKENLSLDEGTPVFVNLPALHHDETLFPEPMKWCPDRFLGANTFDNRDYSYLPFGDGPRSCMGKRFGMLQMKIALAHVIQKYRLEPDVPYIQESDPYSIVLAPKSGGSVKFIPL